VVVGRPDAKYRDWLELRWRGQQYGARARYFASRRQIELELWSRQAELTQRLEDFESRLELLRHREKLLRSLLLDLEYRRNLNRMPAATVRAPVSWSTGIVYPVSTCPAGAVEEVDYSRARRLIRYWEDEIDELEADRKRGVQALADTRRRLIDTTAERTETERKFLASEL